MSVRHHEQLVSHQQREFMLTQSLTECTQALELAATTIRKAYPDTPVPAVITDAIAKYSNGVPFSDKMDSSI